MARPALLTGRVPNHVPDPYKVAARKPVSCPGHTEMLGSMCTVRPRRSSNSGLGAEAREVGHGEEEGQGSKLIMQQIYDKLGAVFSSLHFQSH